MRTNESGRGRPKALAVAVLAVLVAGCGSQAAGPTALKTPSRTATAATPSIPADFPCPGETPTPTPPGKPTPTPTATGTGTGTGTGTADPSEPATPPVTDHYAENHGFREPIPLHGQSRCDGLAAVHRVRGGLEPLRARRDFTPDGTRGLLTGLGYPAAQVHVQQLGDNGVAFTAGDGRICLSGTMSGTGTTVESYAGYPDGTGCEPPRGGH
ncbi:hypothetical protein ACPC54_20720 [Kitasatospora sp. NPDC094028]